MFGNIHLIHCLVVFKYANKLFQRCVWCYRWFSLKGHSAILGTIVGNYVPMGTFPYIGYIQGKTQLVPKGTVQVNGMFGNIYLIHCLMFFKYANKLFQP
jgi:hypothetical protein